MSESEPVPVWVMSIWVTVSEPYCVDSVRLSTSTESSDLKATVGVISPPYTSSSFPLIVEFVDWIGEANEALSKRGIVTFESPSILAPTVTPVLDELEML